jgi:hypothetical protein
LSEVSGVFSFYQGCPRSRLEKSILYKSEVLRSGSFILEVG